MGFKSHKEIKERLNSPANTIVHKKQQLGRSNGDVNLPMEIRKIIAVNSQEGTCRENAETFGVSFKEVHRLRSGVIGDTPNEELREAIGKKKEDAADRAIEILLGSLDLLPDKLERAKAKELSSVAKDMAQVHETLRKKSPIEGANIAFHLYSPDQKKLEDYEVIDVE